MSNPIFAYQDLSRYTLSATSTNASFPLVNLQTYYVDDVWKSASTSAQSIVIDFGQPTAIDFIAITNYQFGSADSVNFQGATDSGFTTGVVTPATISVADGNIGTEYYSFATQTKRYWRLNVLIATPPLATVPYIGNWFIGSKFDWGFPYNNPFKTVAKKYDTIEKIALDGRSRTAQEYGGRTQFELDFTNLSDATRTAFKTFHSTVRGKLRPFYFVDTDGTVYYVYLDNDYDPSQTSRYNVNDFKKIILKTQTVS